MRYRDERGDDWADIIDMLTMCPESWRKGRAHTGGNRCRENNGQTLRDGLQETRSRKPLYCSTNPSASNKISAWKEPDE
jgi:hypothetical protein